MIAIHSEKCQCRESIPSPGEVKPTESWCFECRFACSKKAIVFNGQGMEVGKECDDCGVCADVCKGKAIEVNV